MSRVHSFVTLVILAFGISILAAPLAVQAQEIQDPHAQDKADAMRVAQDWIAQMDSGEYAWCYNNSAEYLQSIITLQDWNTLVTSIRQPMAELLSRELVDIQYSTSLPAVPDGEYVVIILRSSYANKAEAYETVTPMRDTDGQWRVAGYYFR
ncbi:MAG: DUF4019 domain-containing protein [Desulfovibrio sp.]|nr:MAG: DUF4019 domain-containing protein [Desulfovibrio sp.]